MRNLIKNLLLAATVSSILFTACKVPALIEATKPKTAPSSFGNNSDTVNSGNIKWRDFFADQHLVKLIDTALVNNQELSITLQDIEIARNEIRIQQGRILPSVYAGGGAGMDGSMGNMGGFHRGGSRG